MHVATSLLTLNFIKVSNHSDILFIYFSRSQEAPVFIYNKWKHNYLGHLTKRKTKYPKNRKTTKNPKRTSVLTHSGAAHPWASKIESTGIYF